MTAHYKHQDMMLRAWKLRFAYVYLTNIQCTILVSAVCSSLLWPSSVLCIQGAILKQLPCSNVVKFELF